MLSIAVQTHPDRADLAAALADEIPGVDLVVDPDPDNPSRSPWRTYRHALATTPAWASHRLVVQDDVEVCRGFTQAAHRAVAARPRRIVCFFVAGRPTPDALNLVRACADGQSWVELSNVYWLPVVAACWPVAVAREFLNWVETQGWPPDFRSDDEIAGRFMRAAGLRALATVPSLVEHRDLVPSLIGLRARGGADHGRVAACYIDPACDVSTIDWSVGPE